MSGVKYVAGWGLCAFTRYPIAAETDQDPVNERRVPELAIGYACVSLGLPGRMKGCILKNATPERLDQVIATNLDTLSRMLDYNADKGVSLFRISSDIIPLGSHPANLNRWWLDHSQELQRLGDKIDRHGLRVSMHPGQYTVLNALDADIVDRSIADLEYHARFLDSLGVNARHKIILHVGGRYHDAAASLDRFAQNFQRLSTAVQARLVIENDEKFHIAAVLELARTLQIPAVLDVFHHQCYPAPGDHDVLEWLAQSRLTWHPSDGVQKIHYSQQQNGLRPGAHSRTIQLQPFLDFYHQLPQPLDIMLEVKDKDLSALKVIYSLDPQIPRRLVETEWARYKYLVMERSHRHYQSIGKTLNPSLPLDAFRFYLMIDEALANAPQAGQAWNAAQHVWGYFKDVAGDKEKLRWQNLAVGYQRGEIGRSQVKSFLKRMAFQYGREYLLDSYYFLLD